MFYHIAKVICRFCLKLYFGNIHVSGLEHIPKDTPILLASNHPTGFLEPIIIACMTDRPLHFITRGDMFSIKTLNPILIATHQIPIFRFKDGYAGLRKNKVSMDRAKNVLRSNGALLIFVEGRTEDIKMLKPLQKGMARISRTLYKDDVHHMVVPVGINFLDTATFRSRMLLNFGKPIDPRPIHKSTEDDRVAFSAFNDVLFKNIKEQILHVGNRARHKTHDLAIDFSQSFMSNPFFPRVKKDKAVFDRLKTISNEIDRADDDGYSDISQQISKIDYVLRTRHLLQKIKISFLKLIKVVLLFPFALAGLIVNGLPVLGGYAIERKYVKSREFIAPIRFSASLGLGLVWYTILLILGCVLYGKHGFLILLGIPLSISTVYFIDIYRSMSKNYTLSKESKNRFVTIFTHLTDE